jgi:hypothetical protein
MVTRLHSLLRWIVLTGVLMFTSSTAIGAEKTAPAEKLRLALVYGKDKQSADAFKELLNHKKIDVDLVWLGDVLATNFDPYSAVIIASDTSQAWKTSTARHVAGKNRRVLGLGEGGYYCFGALGLAIGSPRGYHGDNPAVRAVRTTESPYWLSSRVPLPTDKTPVLYKQTSFVGIYLPYRPSSVTLIGRDSTSFSHYAIVEQYQRYMFWGFTGSPKQMTVAGKQLFVHTCRYVALRDKISDEVAQKRTTAQPTSEASVAESSNQAADKSAARSTAQPAQLAVFLGSGGVNGPGRIDQVSVDGRTIGTVHLYDTPYGLARRGDALVAVLASGRGDASRTLLIRPDGTIDSSFLRGEFIDPIAVAVDHKTHDLVIADNERNTVTRVFAGKSGRTAILFQAPLQSDVKHYPSVSVAVVRDGHVVFSASDPKGVFRQTGQPDQVLSKPLLDQHGSVAADPTSPRWVAMAGPSLKVFEGTDRKKAIGCPEDAIFWRYGVMAFAPDGRLFVVLETRKGLEVQSVNLDTSRFTPHFVCGNKRIKSMVVGPRIEWR